MGINSPLDETGCFELGLRAQHRVFLCGASIDHCGVELVPDPRLDGDAFQWSGYARRTPMMAEVLVISLR
jgi:hypothetical protein